MSEKPRPPQTPATPAEIQSVLAEGLLAGTFRNLRTDPVFDIYQIDGPQLANVQALHDALRTAQSGLTPGSKQYKKADALAKQLLKYRMQWMESVQAESSGLLDEATQLSDEVDDEVDELERDIDELRLMINQVTGRARLN